MNNQKKALLVALAGAGVSSSATRNTAPARVSALFLTDFPSLVTYPAAMSRAAAERV